MRHARKDYDRIQDPENRIPEDIPVFFILGSDAVGSAAANNLANLVEVKGISSHIVTAARQQAESIYPELTKIPDMTFTDIECKPVFNLFKFWTDLINSSDTNE